MKNNKPATSKLVEKFDRDLMQMLMADLQSFKGKNLRSIKQEAVQQNLSAA